MNDMTNRFDTGRFRTISANGHLIHFDAHGAGWRYETLLDKEPETIEWIDSFEPGDSFWDIGANVGIYSVYAAARGIQTLAFEPHFANYQQLCISIALNGQQDIVTPLCLAFDERKSIGHLNLANLDVGTSMSNFGAALDFRGRPYEAAFRQGMIGYDIDSFIADFGLAVPTHLKIDVDGIELAIVRGARRTLANAALRSVSIELVETDEQQVAAVTRICEEAGLHFIHKKQNSAFATTETADVKNFLFHRDPAMVRRPAATDEAAPAEAEDGQEALFTIDQIVAQIVARIEATPLDGDPCDHICMTDMMPPPVYRELLARLPGDAALDPIRHPDAIGRDGQVTRYLLDLTRDSLARLDPEDQQFWQAMIEIFTAPAIARAITAKFADRLRARFGDAMPELVAVPLLYRDFPGYRIDIHPDAPSKIATLQFYLPADDSQAHLGTVFHRADGAGFARVKANRFSPNSAYAFVRTDESWHSVDEMAAGEAPRNSIALTFYIKGEEYRSAPMDGMTSHAAPAPASSSAPIINDVYDAQMSEALRMLASGFTRRDDVATLFREGGAGVELGVAGGDFSERILTRSRIGYLYSIDMWAGDRGHDMTQYREAIARLAPYRARNALLRMRFDEALPLFADHSLDFLYVDGYAHDGELNGATFRDWFPKLKSGGIIAGDDYHADWPLVVAAVDRFVADFGLERHVIQCGEAESWNSKYPTWFAMKP